jgi:hypothetical protein
MDAKLNDQVTAMFRAAGFTNVATVASDGAVTISAVNGDTRAVFHATSGTVIAAPAGGGRYTEAPELQAAIVPSFPDMRQELLDNPNLATAAGLSAERLDVLRRLPVVH